MLQTLIFHQLRVVVNFLHILKDQDLALSLARIEEESRKCVFHWWYAL